jgi:two-component system sensor histidine kinase and response regulator WspE
VADTVRRANGSLRLESRTGHGTTVVITLPLSQSLLSALVVVAAGETLALPLAHIGRVLRVPLRDVHALADRRFFTLEGQHLDLIPLAPLLELGPAPAEQPEHLPAVVIGNAAQRYALVVDEILGERNLAVQPLPAALAKLRDVAGCALLDDGTPVLMLDHADLLQGIEKLAGEGGLQGMPGQAHRPRATRRVLVVDDSLTVREMERKLLRTRGYEVDVAVDGMDGWNAVRSGGYDLVLTDVDMPRLNGIELVSLIKKDERLRHLPVMIVSYKDRPEDRARGIEAGADYYLAKGSFHDTTLLDAVADLIGESQA